MTITEPGHGPGESSGTGGIKRRRAFTGARTSLTGTLGTMDFTARVGAVCAVLCALLHLGCMTYTLANHRNWVGIAAFVVSLVFAALALLTVAPHVIRKGRPADGLLPRVTMWGTGIVLAGLQLTAAVLGEAEFSMAAVIGITSVLAVPCFGELAAQTVAGPARGTGHGHVPGRGHDGVPGSAAGTGVAGGAAGAAAASGTSGTGTTARPHVDGHGDPAAPATGAVPAPPQERPIADRLRKD